MVGRAIIASALAVLLVTIPTQMRSAEPPKTVDYARDVKPIFAKHCISCHGAEKQKSGLRLDQKAAALAGGDSGKAIVPGKANESHLLKLVTSDDDSTRMPPKGAKLTAAEIATLQAWIEQGAKWPDDGSAIANPADWWSLKPLARAPVPV